MVAGCVGKESFKASTCISVVVYVHGPARRQGAEVVLDAIADGVVTRHRAVGTGPVRVAIVVHVDTPSRRQPLVVSANLRSQVMAVVLAVVDVARVVSRRFSVAQSSKIHVAVLVEFFYPARREIAGVVPCGLALRILKVD